MIAFAATTAACGYSAHTSLRTGLLNIRATVRQTSWDYAGTTFPAWNDHVVRDSSPGPTGSDLLYTGVTGPESSSCWPARGAPGRDRAQ